MDALSHDEGHGTARQIVMGRMLPQAPHQHDHKGGHVLVLIDHPLDELAVPRQGWVLRKRMLEITDLLA